MNYVTIVAFATDDAVLTNRQLLYLVIVYLFPF